ncbi:site-2 protease family protein [Chloroflexota bacterium]
MGGSFSLGSIFGINLRLHYTWFVIFALVTVSLVNPNWSDWLHWIMGVVTSLLFFASVLAHELAHSLVGRAHGIPIKNITLFIFGGVSQMAREATSSGAEFKMAFAGPACSLVIGGVFYVLSLFSSGVAGPVVTMVQWLAIINFALAAFNLIPGFPLDGGRVFRAILWRATGDYRRSTRIATRLGQGIGYLFIVGGVLVLFLQPFGLSWFNGLWLAFIGWFLENAASASYHQSKWQEALRGFTVSELMASDCLAVPSNITIERVVQDYVLPSGRHCFMVGEEGRLDGIFSLRDIKSVPRQNWGVTQVVDIMTPVDKLKVAHLDQDALSILEQMDENDINQMSVVSDGRVIGLVDRDNLVRFLRIRSELGVKL